MDVKICANGLLCQYGRREILSIYHDRRSKQRTVSICIQGKQQLQYGGLCAACDSILWLCTRHDPDGQWRRIYPHTKDKSYSSFGCFVQQASHFLQDDLSQDTWHNGKVERSHRNDQELFYNCLKFYSYEDLQIQMKRYLRRSNRILMSVLGWKTPIQKRQELEADRFC